MDPNAAHIPDEAVLLRRITKSMLDAQTNTLQTWAWKDQGRDGPKEVSVYLAAETSEERVLAEGIPGQIVIKITARDLRELGYNVVRDPTLENPAHCIIDPYPRKRAQLKALCLKSFW